MVQQDRALRTRKNLLDSSGVEFDKHGYLATRLVDISARAGVTRGSLYFHFESKADIAKALILENCEKWAQYVPGRRKQGFYGTELLMLFAHDLVLGFRDDTSSRAAICLIKNSEHIEKEVPSPFPGWVREVRDLLVEAKECGELGADVDIDSASWLVVASIFGIQEMGDQLEQRENICERLDSLWLYLLPGLGVADPAGHLSNVIAAA